MLLYSGLILAGIGPTEIILILVIVLLFFGGKKIPELMKGLGQGMKEFKDASKGEDKKTTSSTEVKPEDK
jgi:sec-independent protein translocase protein TatA